MTTTGTFEEIIDSLGPRAWVLDEMQALRSSVEYYVRAHEALLSKYEGDWVAIYRGNLIAAHRDRHVVVAEVSSRNLAPWQALIRLVDCTIPGTVPARYRLD